MGFHIMRLTRHVLTTNTVLYMKFIVITSPEFVPGEAFLIKRLFSAGLDILHLRKPGSRTEECIRLLDEIPQELHSKIVIHDHFSLCGRYGLKGVHLNSRNPAPPESCNDGRHTISASCHSLQEAAMRTESLDYVFLSPIFNSISKQGYRSAYSGEELDTAAEIGIIGSKTIALGGISYDRIPQLRKWNFGGAAFLGDVWGRATDGSFDEHAEKLSKELHRQQ